MKYLLTIWLFWAGAAAGIAQDDSSFRLERSYSGSVADAALDNLGNLYVLTASDQLKKYSPQGDSMAVYNNVRKFGKVSALDVSNPLKVLLYYKDFSTIVVLDRLLAVRSTLDLRRRNILQASAMSLAYDGNIWLFDAFDSKLKKVNEEGELLLETPDFRSLFGEAVQPQQIIDEDNLLYLYDTARGLYLFDRYGTFKRKVPVAGWSGIRPAGQQLWGITGHSLRSYNLSNLLETQYAFPASFMPYQRFRLSHNKLLALTPDSLRIYQFPTP
ncbi:hypothetical protein V9K67_12305 [Paraflavisolibacter sp. H34]|uniref:hypothetical protein n=1 Tax=Huijunlia imazamoxiresistens TaxID=3127457 RepID=UPI003017EEDB